jgi:16S rRNA (cytosine967-C5)-methyltransferase
VAARVTALRALQRAREADTAAVSAVRAALTASTLDRRDRALAASLAYETLRWQGTLDWVLSHASHRPLTSLDADVRDALRLGAWQLLWGHAPDAAAVSTTVAAAGQVIGGRGRGFVNGVLRGLARRRDALAWPDRSFDEGLALALGYPTWIVAEARARFGDEAEAALAAGNVAPGVTLRATGGPDARPALLAELADEGIDAEPAPHAPESVRAPGADPSRLACVAQGRAVVQDEASTLVGRCALQAGPGVAPPADDVAVDVCAAPGGKARHLAEQGRTVIAGDVHPGRVASMATDLATHPRRAAVHPVVADGRRPPLERSAAGVVLVDAPCSGLGVVRRQPELRWRLAPDDVARLAQRQHELVTAAASLVAPGGLLIVSVCTWTPRETVIAARHADAALGSAFATEVATALGDPPEAQAREPGRQLAPHTDGVDGMYVTVRRRDPGA